MAVFLGLNEYNIAPTSAKKIGVFKDGNLVGYVPLGGLGKSRGNLLYKVGLLSDVHQDTTADTTESYADLQHALSWLKNQGVDFCINCGDILEDTANASVRPAQYQKYGEILSAQSLKVYAVTGNNDAYSLDETNWKKYVNAKNQVTYDDVSYENIGTKMSFEITKGNDHYLFLSMYYWKNDGSDSTGHNHLDQAYTSAELDWLENKLKAYKNERCFVITHLFFPQGAGNFIKGGANYYVSNQLYGDLLERMTTIMQTYHNSIWFSGHSHWKWYCQTLSPNDNTNNGKYCNVWRDSNGAYTIHIPSCAKPLDYNPDGNSGTGARDTEDKCYAKASEGGIMLVYQNAIEIQGISFKSNYHESATTNTSYDDTLLPYADYLLDTTIVNIPEEEPTKVLESITATIKDSYAPIGADVYSLIDKVTAHYSDGSTEEITSGYTINPNTIHSVGAANYTLSYGGKNYYLTFFGEEETPTPTLQSISVTWSATSADTGTNPSTLISKVEANYSDGSKQTVSGYSVSPTALVEGSQTVTVTYQGKTSTKTIVGNAVAPIIGENDIVLTSQERAWTDVTSSILGTNSSLTDNGNSTTQSAQNKIGFYTASGKYSLKKGIDIPVQQSQYHYFAYDMETKNAIENEAVTTRIELMTSSSFLLNSTVNIRVILKNVKITDINGNVIAINGDNFKDYFYFHSNDKETDKWVAPQVHEGDNAFYIDFTRQSQRYLIDGGNLTPFGVTPVVSKINIGNVFILQK